MIRAEILPLLVAKRSIERSATDWSIQNDRGRINLAAFAEALGFITGKWNLDQTDKSDHRFPVISV